MKNKSLYLKLLFVFTILIIVYLIVSFIYNSFKEPCQKSVKAMLKKEINMDVSVNLSFKKIVWDWDFTNIKNNETYIYFKQDIKPIFAKDKSGRYIKITEISAGNIIFMKQVSPGWGCIEITEEEYNKSTSANQVPPSGRL